RVRADRDCIEQDSDCDAASVNYDQWWDCGAVGHCYHAEFWNGRRGLQWSGDRQRFPADFDHHYISAAGRADVEWQPDFRNADDCRYYASDDHGLQHIWNGDRNSQFPYLHSHGNAVDFKR